MKKSFIDRIFPPSIGPLLPQHEQTEPLTRGSSRSPTSSPRIRLLDSDHHSMPSNVLPRSPLRPSSSTSSEPRSQERSLQAIPLSASVLHHDDPFLPVERAARALQDTIQSLLDIQSRALSGRADGYDVEDVTSTGSLTPTQSVITPRSGSGMRAVPIRQPMQKKIGLRGARKGLAKKMREFADLREEELQILETQTRARNDALDRVRDLEERKQACAAEIQSIRQEDTTATAANLRQEAKNVEYEIEELEHKLLELRVRHRHLLSQADQIQSSQDSKLSSFQGSIAMIDRETRNFLRRPPVPHALADGSDQKQLGMYALKPDRRTLEMAREQWTMEQETLARRKVEVENEHIALVEGERVWSSAIRRIDDFERNLRTQTAQSAGRPAEDLPISMQTVLRELHSTISSLELDLATAESKDWNLLICAIGAELEAFNQAREMLEHTQQTADGSASNVANYENIEEDNQPLQNESIARKPLSPNGSVGSNQSLKDTMDEFSKSSNHVTRVTSKYESEDDEPPADFLLSRSRSHSF